MGTRYVGAGTLSEPVQILTMQETEPGRWQWVPSRKAWAQVEQTARTNLFSRVGVGARDAAVVLRRQPLTLHQALSLKGKHLFLTAITDRGRMHLDVKAALVDLVECQADPVEDGPHFPGVLTEKYIKHEQLEPLAVNTTAFVLVTPKVIDLEEGRLVEVAGVPYEVQTAHRLDRYKNEFEIVRKGDL